MDSEGKKKGARPKVVYFVLLVSSMCALRMSMIAHQFPLSDINTPPSHDDEDFSQLDLLDA